MRKILLVFILCFILSPLIFAETEGEILTFPANPDAGFKWGYLLYVPSNIDKTKPQPILFVMNNSGVATSKEEMEAKTLARIEDHDYERKMADKMVVPLLVPFVLRENNDFYPHELNRAVFVQKEGPLARLDLQVLAMFKDARKQLKKKNILTHKKMLIAGASASGAFAWRWTMLHPEYVLAAVSAVQHYPTLPFEEYNGLKLIYPIGVADFKGYTGRKFNKKAWLRVPILEFEGGVDYNDSLPYDECYPGELRVLIHKLLDNGEDDTQIRVRNIFDILAKAAPNVQLHIYPNMGHKFMTYDAVKFLEANKNGGSLITVTLTDTSGWEPALPLKVTALYWGENAPLTHDQKYLNANDLTMKVQKSHMTSWVWKQKKCRVDIRQDGKNIISNKTCGGEFSEKDFNLLQIRFSDDELAQLKNASKRIFTVHSLEPKILEIPENLNFKISEQK